MLIQRHTWTTSIAPGYDAEEAIGQGVREGAGGIYIWALSVKLWFCTMHDRTSTRAWAAPKSGIREWVEATSQCPVRQKILLQLPCPEQRLEARCLQYHVPCTALRRDADGFLLPVLVSRLITGRTIRSHDQTRLDHPDSIGTSLGIAVEETIGEIAKSPFEGET